MEKLKKSNGFTLVELIVVIAILAILTSVSVGGFEYSQKRAAIQNDKALVNQLNRVLDSYGIFTHNEGAIHDALIEEFGNEIEIQSLKFGYDIYYDINIYEFCLFDQRYVTNLQNLYYYLNLNIDMPESDTNSTTNELIIDLANIPNEKISTIGLSINLETNTRDVAYFDDFSDEVSILSCEEQAFCDYVDYISPEINNDKNSICFYNPGVYLLTYVQDNIKDYRIIYVTNTYIDKIEKNYSKSIGIEANVNIHTIYYRNSQITVALSNASHNIHITDYSFSDTNLETIELSDYNSDINRLTIIIEINGIYKLLTFNSKSNQYEFVFEDMDIGNASTANIKYRYFGNDGIWHYSDEIEIEINREN